MSAGTGRRRRRAQLVSEVDRRLLAAGLPPSWEEKVGPEDEVHEGGPDDVATAEGSGNDARLLGDVPPHSQPRI